MEWYTAGIGAIKNKTKNQKIRQLKGDTSHDVASLIPLFQKVLETTNL